MSYKINNSAYNLGLSHGKNAYLLDKKIDNPFDAIDERIAFHDYEAAWYEGFKQEEEECNKLN